MKNWKLLLFWASILFVCGSSKAETIITCSNLTGSTYYSYKGIVPKGKAGWMQDGIKGGKFALSKDADDQLDILYTDATGRVVSSRQDGGTVVGIGSNPNSIVVMVNYPNTTVEVFHFSKINDGTYELLFQQTKYGMGVINKAQTLRGTC